MKAVICTNYGLPEVLQIREVEKPTPGKNEILVKIRATSVTSGDARIRRADPFIIRLIFGFKKPRRSILGIVVAGEIETVGKEVSQFKPGDQVFGTTGMAFGTYAEYVCVAEDGVLALKPKDMTYEEAAAIPFGATASLHFLRKAKIKKGHKILIYGASGALGTAAIQLAKYYGAEVTAVCSTSNLEMVLKLGADMVIDYTKKDFTKNGERYDIIYDTVGKSSYSESLKSLNKNGTMLLANAGLSSTIKGLLTSLLGGKNVIAGIIKETAADMNIIKELIDSGHLKAVIDKSLPLEQISHAHALVDGGHKKGNVVITI